MSDYDTDILTWSERQATLLRRRAAGELVNDAEIDWPNVAEEIESVGRSERRELRNRMARLQQHLLKWQYQPEYRSRCWLTTITTQRREIEALLADSPSLRPTLPDVLSASYRAARDDAITETGLLDLPEKPPFTVEQALSDPLADSTRGDTGRKLSGDGPVSHWPTSTPIRPWPEPQSCTQLSAIRFTIWT